MVWVSIWTSHWLATPTVSALHLLADRIVGQKFCNWENKRWSIWTLNPSLLRSYLGLPSWIARSFYCTTFIAYPRDASPSQLSFPGTCSLHPPTPSSSSCFHHHPHTVLFPHPLVVSISLPLLSEIHPPYPLSSLCYLASL